MRTDAKRFQSLALKANSRYSQPRSYLMVLGNQLRATDIDFDISGLKRAQVLNHLRDVYGQDKVCNVLTLRTEKSKSAILTAARGLGMPPEEGQYLASLVTSERGQLYSLKKMYYGDKDNDISPSSTFVSEMDAHPELWQVAQRIEGLICGAG